MQDSNKEQNEKPWLRNKEYRNFCGEISEHENTEICSPIKEIHKYHYQPKDMYYAEAQFEDIREGLNYYSHIGDI